METYTRPSVFARLMKCQTCVFRMASLAALLAICTAPEAQAKSIWKKIGAEIRRVEQRVEKEIHRTPDNLHKLVEKTGEDIEKLVRKVRDASVEAGGDTFACEDLSYIVEPSDKPKDKPWVVRLPKATKLRLHTGPGVAPSQDIDYQPGQGVVVKPGQWLSREIDGKWVRMSDADHR